MDYQIRKYTNGAYTAHVYFDTVWHNLDHDGKIVTYPAVHFLESTARSAILLHKQRSRPIEIVEIIDVS